MPVRSSFRIVCLSAMSVLLPYCSVLGVVPTKGNYTAKSEEEVDVLSLVVAAEVTANNWTKNEQICFTVEGSYPSHKLVQSLRRRDLNVFSSADWAKKFNCGFELQLEYTQFDLSNRMKVRAKVVDLREINKGEGDLALLLKDGEYSIQKIDGKWSIGEYVEQVAAHPPEGPCKDHPDRVAEPSNWHKVDAGPFSIQAPSGWELHQLTGVDSYVGEFVGDGVALTFDFGRSSSSLNQAKKQDYVIAKESIGGHGAKVVSPRTSGHGITGVYFRKVPGGDALCLWGKDLSPVQQELVLKIFKTIRFGGAMPGNLILPPPPLAKP
jgi:hypothetical protein